MADFDKAEFEKLMGQAVALHVEGRYEAALDLSTDAYSLAPHDSYEAGRAARDNSARYDRLGDADSALVWAVEAHNVHDAILKGMSFPSREALRERSMSAMYVGVNGLRRTIEAKRTGENLPDTQANDHSTRFYMRQAWWDLERAKAQAVGINREVDQYEINASRRVSITESLLGDRKKGLTIGMRAVRLAFMSESPRLDTSEPQLTRKQRLRAKVKAFAGGVAAVGVNILVSPKASKRQRMALALADKML